VQLLGVNAVGQEAFNDLMCQGRVLPWLQDTPAQDVWTRWGVTWRDVVILGPDNSRVTVFNLTTHDLSDTTNYHALKRLLLAAAK
jgi:hypothetical protein